MDGRAVVVVVRVTGREQTHDLIFDVEGRVRRQDPPPTVDHVRGARPFVCNCCNSGIGGHRADRPCDVFRADENGNSERFPRGTW